MRRWLLLGGVFAVLAALVWWFWSLGAVPGEAPLAIRLAPAQGQVEVKLSGSEEWKRVSAEQDIHVGDTVKTGEDGSATVTFYGTAQSRLGASTELVIQEVKEPSLQGFVAKLDLVRGRVWSRVRRLLDIDDAFSVKTAGIVAAVRGTAFDLQQDATGTTVWVSETAVDVTPTAGTKAKLGAPVTEGSMARFDTNGALRSGDVISETARQSKWFLENTARDTEFSKGMDDALQANFQQLHGAEPGSLGETMTALSERLHVTIAPSDAPRLLAAYTSRRLYVMKQMIDQGKSGIALQAYSSLEEEMNARLHQSDGERFRPSFQTAFRRMSWLLQSVDPTSPLYRFKQKLEDTQSRLAGSDVAQTAYDHLNAIQARLDEAGMLISNNHAVDAKDALDAADQGLSNAERELESIQVSAEQRDTLRGKFMVLRALASALHVRLTTALAPPRNLTFGGLSTTTTSTQESVTSTSLVTTSTGMTTSTSATTTSDILRLVVHVEPAQPVVGDAVRLVVTGVYSDGHREDVTARSRFTMTGTGGVLDGPTFRAQSIGRVDVTAHIEDHQQPVEGSVAFTIGEKAPAALTSLRLEPGSGAVAAAGRELVFTATAVYADGSTKDVTAYALFRLMNAGSGTLTGNHFVPASGAGSASVEARYDEGGRSVSAVSSLTITSR